MGAYNNSTHITAIYVDLNDTRIDSLVIVEASAMALVCILALLTNLPIAICILKFPEMQNVTNLYILNLVTADIVLSATLPFLVYIRVMSMTSWHSLGNIACKLPLYVQCTSSATLLWTLAHISVERHKCIVLGAIKKYKNRSNATTSDNSTHKNTQTNKDTLYVLFVVALTWLLNATLYSPLILWLDVVNVIMNGQNWQICTLNLPGFFLKNNWYYSAGAAMGVFVLIVLTFFVPIFLVTFNYLRIIVKIRRIKLRIVMSSKMTHSVNNTSSQMTFDDFSSSAGGGGLAISALGGVSGASDGTTAAHYSSIFRLQKRRRSSSIVQNSLMRSRQEKRRAERHVRITRILSVNVALIIVLWMPLVTVLSLEVFELFLGHWWHNITGFSATLFTNSAHLFYIVFTLAMCTTVTNPVLYGLCSNAKFRVKLLKMFGLN